MNNKIVRMMTGLMAATMLMGQPVAVHAAETQDTADAAIESVMVDETTEERGDVADEPAAEDPTAEQTIEESEAGLAAEETKTEQAAEATTMMSEEAAKVADASMAAGAVVEPSAAANVSLAAPLLSFFSPYPPGFSPADLAKKKEEETKQKVQREEFCGAKAVDDEYRKYAPEDMKTMSTVELEKCDEALQRLCAKEKAAQELLVNKRKEMEDQLSAVQTKMKETDIDHAYHEYRAYRESRAAYCRAKDLTKNARVTRDLARDAYNKACAEGKITKKEVSEEKTRCKQAEAAYREAKEAQISAREKMDYLLKNFDATEEKRQEAVDLHLKARALGKDLNNLKVEEAKTAKNIETLTTREDYCRRFLEAQKNVQKVMNSGVSTGSENTNNGGGAKGTW